ncbi:NADH-quinone oxidoreductase subunit J [Solimonas terrae]|uniref:NADH-quinone oxidoreductase subunit J n=1 Tax=Solimonas terrae TaxID=1396819 RepID=A0A6M2BS25_9GAMM|nr:NADH-quinone oxidoreductase subunit J [Solimonas terrae]NGY05045.1 NADH-quinone oxidoreductase subunit J [Solimonas terrae]
MTFFFYLAAAIAIAATLLVITGRNPVHALLNLVVSLLAVAGMFFMLGAPFAGALEIIVYAGAIMVLFVFVVMMLNLGTATTDQERRWLTPKTWFAPAVLAGLLLAGLLDVLLGGPLHAAGLAEIDARQVGVHLFGPYLLAVELGSMLLLAALVAAYHLGRHD